MDDLQKTDIGSAYHDYLSDSASDFSYHDIKKGEFILEQQTRLNHLIFLIDGEIVVNYNEFHDVQVGVREFFLIPKKSSISIKILKAGDMLIFSFDSFKNTYDKIALNSYIALAEQAKFIFRPLPMRYVINDFVYMLVRYLRNGLNDPHMAEVKRQELFILLRKFYDKNEITNLLYPVLSKSLNFKDQILQHYQEVGSVGELADKIGMGRTNFGLKFKNEFGIPPLQWMLQEKAKQVRFSMADPENTLSDIMRKYNFNSPTHLNRFCKQQFGCSPSELMKKVRK